METEDARMVLKGLQKLTLLDYPGRTACTVFTGGCNFRCPFCHNASLVVRNEGEELRQDELLAFLRRRSGILDGVVITGGEPLLHPDLGLLLREIRALGYAIKLDTNGSFPQRLRALMEEGLLDYVAMDIKNAPERYAATVGVPQYDLTAVRESAALLLGGGVEFEFRTTVVKGLHFPGDFAAIGQWIAGAPRYFLQAFRDSGDLVDPSVVAPKGEFTREELEAFRQEILPYVPAAALRGID
jgi:pyruvate formate lyase activating enzyme